MSPFFVYNEIKKAKKNQERITIDELGRRCGARIRHRYIRMSKQMFECEQCGGFPRHWVKGIQPHSWITLWFYIPPKLTDFTDISKNPDEFEIPMDLSEFLKQDKSSEN